MSRLLDNSHNGSLDIIRLRIRTARLLENFMVILQARKFRHQNHSLVQILLPPISFHSLARIVSLYRPSTIAKA